MGRIQIAIVGLPIMIIIMCGIAINDWYTERYPSPVILEDVGVGACLKTAPDDWGDRVDLVDCTEPHEAQKTAELIVPAMAVGDPDIPKVIKKVAAECPAHVSPAVRTEAKRGNVRLYALSPTSSASHLYCLVAAGHKPLSGSVVTE
jgi:hypothetical protein